MKRLLVAAIVSLVVVVVVMSRKRPTVGEDAELLRDRIDRSKLPSGSKEAMRELLARRRLRPSQFKASALSPVDHT